MHHFRSFVFKSFNLSIFVAIDSMMRPIPIPQLVVENDDEQIDWDKAAHIREQMLSQKEN